MRASRVGRAALGVVLLATAISGHRAAEGPKPSPEVRLKALEARSGGRLGVVVVDTGTGRRWTHRENERFALCSTFKFPLVAAVLARVDSGLDSLDRRVAYTAADLLDHSPVTTARLKEGGMTVGALCEAAVTKSDNAAANLLLKSLGGPTGLTQYLRSLGDPVTRLDRYEPELNSNEPGDLRDTTTPAAMAETARRILLGDALSPASRERLIGWLEACETGAARIRAGVPPTWRVGDKTGTGAHGAANDVAILWPPGRAPLLVAAYTSGSKHSYEECNAVLAEVGRIVVSAAESGRRKGE